MAHIYRYAILQLIPFAHRDEAINVGIVVFADADLQVRLSAPPTLLSYFGIQSSTLDWVAERIAGFDNPELSVEERAAGLSGLSGIRLSEIGWFSTDEESQYEKQISRIISEYVDKPRRPKSRKIRKNIAIDLKRAFKGYDIFGRDPSDLDRHKVVANMPVGPSGKLHVDFLLKNGTFHATETLDFRASEEAGAAELKNAALASVTFQHARDILGARHTKCYLVYAAPSLVESAVSPAISIASREATQIFNMESQIDKNKYFDLILAAAGVNRIFS